MLKNLFVGIFLFTSLAALAKEEIVLTVPMETSVSVPGLRATSEVWLDLIRGAKKQIHLEHFYLSDEPGEALGPILTALRKAAGRGVEVRLILDSKFFKTYPEPATSLAKLPRFSLKVVDFEKISGGIQHAKFMIVDESRYYVGSANMDWRALAHIHEVGVAGEEAEVAQKLDAIFAMDWGTARPSETAPAEKSATRVVGSPERVLPKSVGYSLPEIEKLLDGSQKEVELALYELSTKIFGQASGSWHALFDALERAAKRGTKVRILIDATKAHEGALAKLKAAGVEIRKVQFPEYSGGPIPFARLLHSKFLVVDSQTAWVGTDNWAKNYFHNSRGVGLIFEDPNLVRSLRAVFAKLWESSYAASL